MLRLTKRIFELHPYGKKFDSKEKVQLTECFEKIQDYILDTYSKTSRRIVELQLHDNAYTHSYLVIDFENNEVYLSHRDHGNSRDDYFCSNESSHIGWKYALCVIVIENWQDIKETLDKYFETAKNVSDLCGSFKI
mgnify:CR=1 FL=1|jgi:hypothetical protein